MSPRPHDGPAEEGLSSSFLGLVQDPERVESIRIMLSGFCHKCRNSLNGIKMSFYLFRREAKGAVPDCWGDLESIYHQVEHLFDHLQSIYRPMTLTTVRSRLDEMIDHHAPKWRSWFETKGRTIRLDPPECPVPADFDPAQLGAGLDAMATWRASAVDVLTLTRVAWRAHEGSIELLWEEVPIDEPPVPPDVADGIPRREGNSTSRPVDALALPLLARIVAAHGGRLQYSREPALVVRLRWPQFQPVDRCDEA
jgi:hypothetical protein